VKDGWEAMEYLEKRGDYAKAKTLSLILMDLNLVKVNGYEVFKNIKDKECLKHLPVTMLSRSSFRENVLTTCKNHANCGTALPIDENDFLKVIGSIKEFWCSVVQISKNN